MAHQRHRFVEKVDFITSPGFGSGGSWRKDQGLPRGGPSAVITDKGVLRFDAETKEMVLVSIHPGVSEKDVLESTEWDLKISPSLCETKSPSQDEMAALEKFDPEKFWTA